MLHNFTDLAILFTRLAEHSKNCILSSTLMEFLKAGYISLPAASPMEKKKLMVIRRERERQTETETETETEMEERQRQIEERQRQRQRQREKERKCEFTY